MGGFPGRHATHPPDPAARRRSIDDLIADAPLVVTSEFMRRHDLAVVVHGSDLSEDAIEAVYADPKREGRLELVDPLPGLSTTAIIERVLRGRHGRRSP